MLSMTMPPDLFTIYGDGRQTRCFCYVDDQIEAWIRFMDSGDDLTGPINLANPCEITILEPARMTLGLTGSRSALVRRPLPADDPQRRCPDIALAREKLKWQPQTPLKEGLAATIAYFESLLGDGRRKIDQAMRPRKLVTDLSPDNSILKEALSGNDWARGDAAWW